MINTSESNIEKVIEYVEETLGETLTESEAIDYIDFFNSLIEDDVVVPFNRLES